MPSPHGAVVRMGGPPETRVGDLIVLHDRTGCDDIAVLEPCYTGTAWGWRQVGTADHGAYVDRGGVGWGHPYHGSLSPGPWNTVSEARVWFERRGTSSHMKRVDVDKIASAEQERVDLLEGLTVHGRSWFDRSWSRFTGTDEDRPALPEPWER